MRKRIAWMVLCSGMLAGAAVNAAIVVDKTPVAAIAPERSFIEVMLPKSDDNVWRGGHMLIQWRASGDLRRFNVFLRTLDRGFVRSYDRVEAIGPEAGNQWRWTWNVPLDMDPGLYALSVRSEDNRISSSEKTFFVIERKIEVTMPRAGQRFRRGATMTIQYRTFGITQNLRIYQEGYMAYAIAENVSPAAGGIVEWHNVGGSADGRVTFPGGGRIVVATMDGAVSGFSHAYILEEK